MADAPRQGQTADRRERLLAAAMDTALWTICGRGEAAYRDIARQMGRVNRAAAKKLGVQWLARMALARAAEMQLIVSAREQRGAAGGQPVTRWRLTAAGDRYVSAARPAWNGPGGRPASYNIESDAPA